ncbi:MAG: DUF1949 domain-containing protein [Candidatus Kapaibacterium sp.]|nr:MAG: DUF1949 domain-containing protein [Candidatus Kapabacteria bacterium]
MTHQSDSYCTIASRERAEIVVKASRFIGSLAPAKSKEEAMLYIDDIRKEFYDATHNCFAYRLGEQGLNFRTADDGEPNGSAGKPILFELQKANVSDVVLVVTRYYGGTKLGVGGLARAYSSAAEEALKLCTKLDVIQTKSLRIFCVYEDVNIIKRLLHHYATKYEETYGDAVEFVAHVPLSKGQEFSHAVTEATSARAGVVEVLGELL